MSRENKWALLVACCGLLWGATAQAQGVEPSAEPDDASEQPTPAPNLSARAGGDRPTIQNRFAPKKKLLYANALLMTHVRDDFYNTWGYGVDVGYFKSERWGFELRGARLETSLDPAARDLQLRLGLVPDARPQDWWLQAGARYSPGYGKMLMWRRFMMHFDPQFALHAGVAIAERRYIPTVTMAFSLMSHWRWGIKARVDLGMSVQGELRERGWVVTTGFAPFLGAGWGYNF